MKAILIKIFDLFSRSEKRRIYVVFSLIVVMGLLEMMGVASVAPFIAVASNPEIVQTNAKLEMVYDLIQPDSTNDFLVILGFSVLILITLSNLFAAFTTWAILRFTNMQGHRLSKKLFEQYLTQSYEFFLDRNSSELSKNMFSEVGRVVLGVLSPCMRVIAKSVVVLFILALLLITDPLLTLVVFIVLGGFYVVVFAIVRRKVSRYGKMAVQYDAERYKTASEAFGGIKQLKLSGSEGMFLSDYSKPSRLLAECNASSQTISQLPRYFLEIIAFGSVLVVMLYLMIVKDGVGPALPFIALYTFAGYRLMPALQVIFNGMAMIRYNTAALDLLHKDIAWHDSVLRQVCDQDQQKRIVPRENIILRDITYTYPGTQTPVIDKLNIEIKANTTIGIVGATGSGKTTVLDIFLGLLPLQDGALFVDGMHVTGDILPQWQSVLGYVPQYIFLVDATITKNIAFGVADKDVDQARVVRVCKMANLHEFITSSLSDGYDTVVGEDGVKLSGGQRQRIGIARALYHNPEVLVFDEATSALDAQVEQAIMDEIYGLSEKKTVVIVTHRLSTIVNCDEIFFMDSGRVVARGSYHELLEKCDPFRRLAKTNTE